MLRINNIISGVMSCLMVSEEYISNIVYKYNLKRNYNKEQI